MPCALRRGPRADAGQFREDIPEGERVSSLSGYRTDVAADVSRRNNFHRAASSERVPEGQRSGIRPSRSGSHRDLNLIELLH